MNHYISLEDDDAYTRKTDSGTDPIDDEFFKNDSADPIDVASQERYVPCSHYSTIH